VTRGPAHAGKLQGWERVVFALVFVVMGGFVAAATIFAARSGHSAAQRPAHLEGSSARTLSAGSAGTGALQPVAQGGSADGRAQRGSLDTILNGRLAAALRPVVTRDHGHIAVGVIDASTGAEALYDSRRSFRTASIAKTDILAALLLRAQQAGTSLTNQQAELAAPMIEESDDQAADDLWRMLGAGPELAAANTRLGLAHTVARRSRSWSLTGTTVADQLRLLSDLISAASPLNAASRDYELGLMEDVVPSQQWGVSAAASPGTVFAVKDGWLPDRDQWVINSVGVVVHDGQRLLIAILSNDQQSEAAGIAADSAAARAAARVVTAAS
jgi:beta-lactamase class A